ncbi:60s acidic ribosomal protein-domain-containing protein [Aspergillus egyptiacus]|nr:60s acidic ribosomal protein-domain-containing protein [Aspergillus egyptiacus]
MSTAELACSYASLILADEGIEITADKLQTLLSAAKIQEVEPIWTSIFAKALEGKDIKDLLTNVGSAGAAAPAAAAGGAGAAAGGEAAAPAEEKKEEEKEESDEDMGFGLFD